MRDLYQKTRASTSTPSTGDPPETPGEAAAPPEVSRKKLCINFLQTIDQTGQYEPLYSSSIQDPVKAERISRLDSLTQVVWISGRNVWDRKGDFGVAYHIYISLFICTYFLWCLHCMWVWLCSCMSVYVHACLHVCIHMFICYLPSCDIKGNSYACAVLLPYPLLSKFSVKS